MLKKIALLCLVSSSLLCSEKPNPPVLIPTTITDSLKGLDAKITAHHKDIISILGARLPRLPRTKIFLGGALAGTLGTISAAYYVQENHPELLAYPQAAISKIQAVLNTIPTKTDLINPKAYTDHAPDGTNPDESGAENAAAQEEQKAAEASGSCYFR